MTANISMNSMHLKNLKDKLEACSYENVLKRGFALVTTDEKITVRNSTDARRAKKLCVRFKDDYIWVNVIENNDNLC